MWTKGRSYVDMSVEVWTKVLTVWKRVLNSAEGSADLHGHALNYVEKSVELADKNVQLCEEKSG
jgi:hypothetical protein